MPVLCQLPNKIVLLEWSAYILLRHKNTWQLAASRFTKLYRDWKERVELANIRLAEFKNESNVNGKSHSINIFSPRLIKIIDSSVFVEILYLRVN